jgi:catechol-2,3-dioxygenase
VSARAGLADGICELVIEADDLDAMRRFYEELGLPVLAREDDRIWLAAGPRARLGLWTPGTKEHGDRGGRHVHFALAVDSDGMRDAMERLGEAGVEVHGPVEHEGGDHSVYFSDPEGNRVELWNFFHDGEGAELGVRALDE